MFVTDEMEVTATETELVTDTETVTEATVEDGTVTGTEGALTDAGHLVSMFTKVVNLYFGLFVERIYKVSLYFLHNTSSGFLFTWFLQKRRKKGQDFNFPNVPRMRKLKQRVQRPLAVAVSLVVPNLLTPLKKSRRLSRSDH